MEAEHITWLTLWQRREKKGGAESSMGVECYVSAEELSVFVFDLRAAARREGAMEDAERGNLQRKFPEEVAEVGIKSINRRITS